LASRRAVERIAAGAADRGVLAGAEKAWDGESGS